MDAAQRLAEQCAEAMYTRDAAVIAAGILIDEVGPGYARVRMRVRADMLNSHLICHGGVVFTLSDTAFAYACNSYGLVTVAASASIELLLPSREGDELIAEARECSRGRRSGIYDITVRNQRGETVALFRGRSHQTQQSIPPPTGAAQGGAS
ncbi:MAG: hydroxyphenylacetyl-CoA thioesterase PaaI [Proteobacteria bacterium]|nr:hydroxyphenylacetyl-CoA thioesterase PaaI [Pseudomonadota bacterium]